MMSEAGQKRDPSPRDAGAGPAGNLRSKTRTSLDAAVLDFIATSDRLSKFESQICAASSSSAEPNSFTLKIRLDQIQSLWDKVEREYEAVSRLALHEGGGESVRQLQSKYENCYLVYERCASQLNEHIARLSAPSSQGSSNSSVETFSKGCRLPPCDTEIFTGDYLRWPTFRDLFTAIYIDNSRLTPVEKLFHLNAKTSGEAHAIVIKSPLTNSGFQSAWSALQERFENKRLLVNSQLKVLFNLPKISTESGTALKDLQSTIQGCLIAMEHSNVSTENWDCILIFFCSSKLPTVTLSLWEQSLNNKSEIPTWDEMNSFLEDRYRTLEAIEEVRLHTSNSQHTREPRNPQPRRVNSFETQVGPRVRSCDLCSRESHPVRQCPRFLQMTQPQRVSYIKQKRLCLNCLAKGHNLRECTSRHNCFTCKGRHNTLLHKESPATSTSAAQAHNPDQPTANTSVHFASNRQGILLGTAIVQVCHQGENFPARALIDSGSEGTFISEKLATRIKLPCQTVRTRITGLNQTSTGVSQRMCHFQMGTAAKPMLKIDTTALVLPNLAGNLPTSSIDRSILGRLPNIPLADPLFFQPSQIDLLIGADILPSVLLSGLKPNLCGSLLGQETIFGWILTGPVSTATSRVSSFTTKISIESEPTMETLLTKFWEVEDLPCKVVKESDNLCKENFARTTIRSRDGKYVVSLPFKDAEHINLGHSRSFALAQFLRNETSLKRDPILKDTYDSVIKEYIDLGHMKPVPPNTDTVNFYLPHHAVFKPESTTTKVRVVFNASSPSSNGNSLNDILHPGPVLQSDLTLQILKLRTFQFVFNADITKMYRQIPLNPAHTAFQRILFRDDRGDIRDYELQTVTFGVNCAPFLALRTLRQLSEDVHALYPRASRIISDYMYVDDVLAGAHTKVEATLAIQELRTALSSAGFPLRKWTANERTLLKALPSDHLLSGDFLDIEEVSTTKTLGIRWNAKADEFYFVPTELVVNANYSKRNVLSQIAKLFDPAGWLSPFVVQAKILMQDIWLAGIGWDEFLPAELRQRWHDFLRSHSSLHKVRVPRWVQFRPGAQVQIHGFCDASQKAYGAAIYVRIQYDGGFSSSLLTSKTKVAPVKTVSLPRLELCGAVLLADLWAAILPHIPFGRIETFFWTDSTIVLAWLNKPPCQWTTFVANRVTKIALNTDASQWSHVRSEHNPADLASRGVTAEELASSDLWWHGPSWLSQPQVAWPTSHEEVSDPELERRSVRCHLACPAWDLLERFSNFNRMLRVMAFVQRFINRCRCIPTPSSTDLSSKELAHIQLMLIRQTQRADYPEEYNILQSKGQLPSSSCILNLNPFLDADGIMRSCGRLTASDSLSYDERHPILLAYHSKLAELLVTFTHRISIHGGNQLMVRLIRTRYWIPKLRNLIKRVTTTCKVCVIHRKKVQSQLMGKLPQSRATYSRPFTHTGLDFAGPFDVKSYSGRACRITKGYVCVFVCFSTKAIHLEATSDLTTEKFLGAFSRFAARRGCPLHLYSDNGKTFVGAEKALTEDFIAAVKEKVTSSFSHQSLSWHFNPPGAPHMGGLWEAGVKSFKTHFYKTTDQFQRCQKIRRISSLSLRDIF
ncbi:uncharacterized protein LOC122620904 isoform X3 [Drosophila teissieri]|uniref:uncharacterized protein LOC122620904 isoform X3 n=1 Tax=Drosophila teissieri TaxID=7243 RepID=UPI001CB9E4B7|nr:uncharacterized protein LOC122620904 isoform X3 [Drosophila teissieri]